MVTELIFLIYLKNKYTNTSFLILKKKKKKKKGSKINNEGVGIDDI